MLSLIGLWRSIRQRVLRYVMPVAATLAALVAFAQPLRAQAAPAPLAKGARVRLVLRESGHLTRYHPGTLLRLERDTCVLSLGSSGTDTLVSVLGGESGWRLERVAGTHTHTGRWLVIGTVTGALAGLTIYAFTWIPGSLELGVLGGVALGLVIGKSTHHETWEPVHTAGVEIALTPRAVGLRLRF